MRPYEYEIVVNWWKRHGQMAPPRDMLPEDTTYVVEVDKRPVASAVLYVTNCKKVSMVEHVIGDPDFNKEKRRMATEYLFRHLEQLASKSGYTILVIFAYADAVKLRYEELGFVRTLDNVTTFAKRISTQGVN